MNTILKIGHWEILLPSESLAMAAMKALSKGILIDSRFVESNGEYQYIYEIEEKYELEMEMKILPQSAKIIDGRKNKKQLRLSEKTPNAKEEHGLNENLPRLPHRQRGPALFHHGLDHRHRHGGGDRLQPGLGALLRSLCPPSPRRNPPPNLHPSMSEPALILGCLIALTAFAWAFGDHQDINLD